VSLEQIKEKIKSRAGRLILAKITVFFASFLIMVDVLGVFLLLRIKTPPEIEIIKNFYPNILNPEKELVATGGGNIVASKNGKKYYFVHCSGANRIKNENKIYFSTIEAAEGAGYTLAANCE